MERLTYRQAFDKITEAYIKGEIKPFNANFCFCGTLNNNSHTWTTDGICDTGYFGFQLLQMELALFKPLRKCGLIILGGTIDNTNDIACLSGVEDHPLYEESIFEGICNALEVLKQIHVSRGEIIDEDIPAFTKRELQPTN